MSRSADRPAYFVSFVRFREPERFGEYAQLMFPALMAHGAQPIAHIDPEGVTGQHATATVIEGSWPGVTSVVRFPSRAALEAFVRSPEYRAAKALRDEIATSDIALVDEMAWPPPTI